MKPSGNHAAPVPGDVQGAMEALGIEIDRAEGGEIWARCPRHALRTGKADRHPSFSVNEDSGLFCCLSCGYSGAFPQLACDLLGLDPHQADVWVREQGSLAYAVRTLDRRARSAGPPPWAAEPDLAGYVEPPPAALRERGIYPEDAARYGILWDAEAEGWILPIRDPYGVLMGYQFKKGHFVRNRPRGVPKATTLFGAHLMDGGAAILVESPLDCARIFSAGFAGAVASFGAVVSDAQIDLLVSRADEVVIALDNPACDEAGALNAPLVEARLRGRVRPIRYFRYPDRKTKDPGDMSYEDIRRGYLEARSSLALRLAAR